MYLAGNTPLAGSAPPAFAATLRRLPFIASYFRQSFLFGHPKRKRKRCPLLPIAREARPRGCSPLGTPKGWSSAEKAKTCRSAARFLTLFRPSPIAPSGAKIAGVESGSPRGELSPKVTEGWLGEVRTSGATPHPLRGSSPRRGATGRRGRRPLQPNENKQQTREISHRPTVECWPRAGASPSALGFLRETARSAARTVKRAEPFPLSRASRAIGSSGHLFRFLFGCPKRKD